MDEAIQTIIGLLKQDWGSRQIPGWNFVLAAIVSVLTGLTAREMARKRRETRERVSTKLMRGSSTASINFDENGADVRHLAELRIEEGFYRVVVKRLVDNSTSVESEFSARNIDELSEMLRSQTKFVLGDFER